MEKNIKERVSEAEFTKLSDSIVELVDKKIEEVETEKGTTLSTQYYIYALLHLMRAQNRILCQMADDIRMMREAFIVEKK